MILPFRKTSNIKNAFRLAYDVKQQKNEKDHQGGYDDEHDYVEDVVYNLYDGKILLYNNAFNNKE